MKKISVLFFSFIVAFVSLTSVPLMAADAAARTVSILTIEGTVSMTKGAVKEFKAKEGLKLLDGYTVTTGPDSACTLNLDDTATVVLDQKSKVEISKLSANKLTVSVLSGTVAVNAEPQKAGESVEIGAGNSTMAIRGTLFTFGRAQDGSIQVNMIEGTGDFDGYTVTDSETLSLSPGKGYDKTELKLDENSGLFLLETILNNKEELLETGKFPEEYFSDIDVLVEKIEAAGKDEQGDGENISSSDRSSPIGGSSSGGGHNNNGGNNNDDDDDDDDNDDDKTEYPVTYDLNDDSFESNFFAPKGTSKTSDSVFEAAFVYEYAHPKGYDLLWWNTAPDGESGDIYKPGSKVTMPNHQLTLYAKWDGVAKVKIILDSGFAFVQNRYGGKVVYNTAYEIPGNPFDRWDNFFGYKFLGWRTAEDKTGTLLKPGATIEVGESDITLYAQWTRAGNEYHH